MKKKLLASLLLASSSLLILASCGQVTSSPTGNSSGPEFVTDDEMGGGQVDTDVDNVSNDISKLKSFLEKLMKVRTYTYETTYNYISDDGTAITESVIDYYGNHYFYEENLDYPADSFGYAEEAYEGADKNVFYIYTETEGDEIKVIPSLYEYSTLSNDEVSPITEVFGAFGVAGLHNFHSETLDELAGVKMSENEYRIDSSSSQVIFQFMTQVGTSISTLMTGVELTILDEEALTCQVTIDLGVNGTIVSKLTPHEETKYSFIDDQLTSGELRGVAYYQDVATLFENTLSNNNYTIKDITLKTEIGTNPGTFSAYINDKYFLIDFDDQYNQSGYADWGRMLLPANTKVDLYDLNTMTVKETVSKEYSSVYEFSYIDGKVYFTSFIGPNEISGGKYIEVATEADLKNIPEEDLNESNIYIVTETNKAYVYGEIDGSTGEMGFKFYDDWFATPGDTLINGMATFYTSSTIFQELGRYYFEKDVHEDNHYYSRKDDVIYAIASTLFGYGFQPTTTWIDDIYQTDLIIEKDGEKITGADLSVSFQGPDGDSTYSYHLTDFGTTNVSDITDVYNSLLGGN